MYKVKAEWHRLREVLIHRPGIEMLYGVLDPGTFLYQRRLSVDKARWEHMQMEEALREAGVIVHRLKKVIIDTARRSKSFKELLVKRAVNYLDFEGEGNVKEKKERFERDALDLDPETLFNIILLSPIIIVNGRNSQPVVVNRTPLANLYFMRDQLAVGDKGIIMGRMASSQRERELTLVEMAIKSFGQDPVYSVKKPNFFEGGDFLPMGEFAIIGIGSRTNYQSAIDLIENALGFEEVVLVDNSESIIEEMSRDSMVNMHLDTYINTPKEGVVVANQEVLDRAKAEVYEERGKIYSTTLGEYLKKKGFSVIPITILEQLAFAPNFLTIDNGLILAVEVEKIVKKIIEFYSSKYPVLEGRLRREFEQLKNSGRFFPRKKEMIDFGIDYININIAELTGGYGGAHCMTASLRRE